MRHVSICAKANAFLGFPGKGLPGLPKLPRNLVWMSSFVFLHKSRNLLETLWLEVSEATA